MIEQIAPRSIGGRPFWRVGRRNAARPIGGTVVRLHRRAAILADNSGGYGRRARRDGRRPTRRSVSGDPAHVSSRQPHGDCGFSFGGRRSAGGGRPEQAMANCPHLRLRLQDGRRILSLPQGRTSRRGAGPRLRCAASAEVERPDPVADPRDCRRRGPVPSVARGAELFRRRVASPFVSQGSRRESAFPR